MGITPGIASAMPSAEERARVPRIRREGDGRGFGMGTMKLCNVRSRAAACEGSPISTPPAACNDGRPVLEHRSSEHRP